MLWELLTVTLILDGVWGPPCGPGGDATVKLLARAGGAGVLARRVSCAGIGFLGDEIATPVS